MTEGDIFLRSLNTAAHHIIPLLVDQLGLERVLSLLYSLPSFFPPSLPPSLPSSLSFSLSLSFKINLISETAQHYEIINTFPIVQYVGDCK